MNIRVVVADDHDLVRTGIVRMLADIPGIEVVGEASSGEEALQAARNFHPDVVLMDVMMPGMGGMEATKKLVRQFPESKVVAVSALDEGIFPSRLLKAGALGYINKGAALAEMVSAVKHAAAGKRYLSAAVAQQMALNPVDAEKATPFEQLSEREMQVCMMVINSEKVQDISDKLCLSPKTVNGYRYRIFEKLGVSGDVELTRLAIRHGILDPQEI
jgi:two-component system invasion response regulator UvrY